MLGFVIFRTFLSGLVVLAPPGATPDVALPPALPPALAQVVDGIDFGDDGSDWSNDGECDDKRFVGPGMTTTALLGDDIGHDASDCRAAWQAGRLELFQPAGGNVTIDGIDFGDDSGSWVNDNQCDDPRFEGAGMASFLTEDDRLADASDCSRAYVDGEITLRGDDGAAAPPSAPIIEDGVDFGSDSGRWTHDGECDDPRFKGAGMAGPPLLDADIRADASDCLNAWRNGDITLIAPDPPHGGGAPSISNRPGDRGGR